MVDVTDIPAVNRLVGELRGIDQAIRNVESGGLITSMVIAPGREASPDEISAQIITTYMRAPTAMYDAILGLMRDRREDIESELRNIGVSGVNGR
jgi:hypothetical protein